MAAKIAILASGAGTNAQAIIDKAQAGALEAEIALVLSNRPGAPVLARAARAGIPHVVLDHTTFTDRLSYDQELAAIIKDNNCGIVALAGYMRLLSGVFLKSFKGDVLNIHPALLPSFPGTHGARDAMGYGVKITGCSVHFVEEQMDSGPIVIQAAVPVMDFESLDALKNRIHRYEYRIYPQALQWLATGRLRKTGRRVELQPGKCEAARPATDALVWPPLEQGF